MTDKESKAEAKEEKSSKAVSVQRAAMAPFKGFSKSVSSRWNVSWIA
jgi:hypothetical protein